MNDKYIIAYSYQDKFEIDDKLARALIVAKKAKQAGIEDRGRFYSTQFLWIMPVAETSAKKLTASQMIEAGRIGQWLAMPIHELGWGEGAALEYAVKLVGRVDLTELRRLSRVCGHNGTYPDARRFMSEARQLEGSDDVDVAGLLEG